MTDATAGRLFYDSQPRDLKGGRHQAHYITVLLAGKEKNSSFSFMKQVQTFWQTRALSAPSEGSRLHKQ